jgi:L-rhamnose isomerase
MDAARVERAYNVSKERYAELGVDSDAALAELERVSISLPCWQGDDVGGFEETKEAVSSGVIQATGNYPGRPHAGGASLDLRRLS